MSRCLDSGSIEFKDLFKLKIFDLTNDGSIVFVTLFISYSHLHLFFRGHLTLLHLLQLQPIQELVELGAGSVLHNC